MEYNLNEEDIRYIVDGIIEEVGRVKGAKIIWHLNNFYRLKNIEYNNTSSEYLSNIEKIKGYVSNGLKYVVIENEKGVYWVNDNPLFLLHQDAILTNKTTRYIAWVSVLFVAISIIQQFSDSTSDKIQSIQKELSSLNIHIQEINTSLQNPKPSIVHIGNDSFVLVKIVP